MNNIILISLICAIIMLVINWNKIRKHAEVNELPLATSGKIDNNIISNLISDAEIKFKESDNISKKLSKELGFEGMEIKIPELENFDNYAPKDIIKFSETYSPKNIKSSKVDSTLLKENKLETESTPLTELSSEMTTQWYEKTSKDAHSHYFNLMDSLPRINVPLN